MASINPRDYHYEVSPVALADHGSWRQANLRFSQQVLSGTEVLASPYRTTTFASEVLDFYARGIDSALFQNYVRYALNSLYRGAKVASDLSRSDLKANRYLDVGCAYGGCPIVMAETGAAGESVGIEYEERLLELARTLASERNVSDRVTFHAADITSKHSVAALGKFDLITCLDVLEHVLDPEAAIVCLAGLLADGGTLRVDIPNKFAIQQIKSDPHHHLFGSILLSREDAIRVFERAFPGNKRYTVGYFHSLEWYVERFSLAGLSTSSMDITPIRPDSVREVCDAADELVSEYEFKVTAERWDPWRIDCVRTSLLAYRALLQGDATNVSQGSMSVERFLLKYSVPVFHFRCNRP